ncbi:hypothetical protein HDU78_011124 [Chytriomyces hyalinus]|nr:hypothetical protein HDU78_011124 [Chytriomyces hyalinus]
MLLKLIYITYSNWNPDELKEEKFWYFPELVFVLPFCSNYFLRVFDNIAAHPTLGVMSDLKIKFAAGPEELVEMRKEMTRVDVDVIEASRVDVVASIEGRSFHCMMKPCMEHLLNNTSAICIEQKVNKTLV